MGSDFHDGDAFVSELQAWLEVQMKDPEVRAKVERREKVMDLVGLAERTARRDVPDPAARDELAEQIADVPAPIVKGAVDHFAALRGDFVGDRAFRLITAAVDRSAVRPIDPRVSDLFMAEERLGRMSLMTAFAHLASLEPRLTAFVKEIEPTTSTDPHAQLEHMQNVSDRLEQACLVGDDAASALLRTDLAERIVRDYLRLADNPKALNDATPVFERRFGVITGRVGYDDRPRAAN